MENVIVEIYNNEPYKVCKVHELDSFKKEYPTIASKLEPFGGNSASVMSQRGGQYLVETRQDAIALQQKVFASNNAIAEYYG